ncbi:MAG TPA: ABC transporter permease, partial [Anaerolineaceae bacterium]|nr:ABC transporter permease [Anaerolineaceae bacterium]
MSLQAPAVKLDRRAVLQRFGLLISFLVLFVALTILSDRFLQVSNLVNILRQASINGIISVGMTLVILTGGIDLSVGSILAFSAVIGADLMKSGTPVGLAVAAALAIGAGLGAINGLIIVRGRIPAFIATLGMLTVARGLTLMYTQGQPVTSLPETFRFIGAGVVAGLPMPILVAGLTFAVGSVLLSRTRTGEHIYLIGDNLQAARLAGLPTQFTTVLVYVISGFCSALAGLV